MKIFLIIPGDPMAKARPRVVFRRNIGRHIGISSVKTVRFERLIKLVATKHFRRPLPGPLVMNIRIFRSIPKSFSKKMHARAEAGEVRPGTRPDVDNYLKSCLDGLNRIAFHDDSQVVSVNIHKFYSHNPRTEIEVEEL